MPVPVVLRKGESVVWLYSTKHAATPNPIDLNIERNLFYAVYGPAGRADTGGVVRASASKPRTTHTPSERRSPGFGVVCRMRHCKGLRHQSQGVNWVK